MTDPATPMRPTSEPSRGVTRVVVLGGGFAGAYCAQHLMKLAHRHVELRGRVEVVLIDRNNYFVFTPLLVEAAVGNIEPAHAVVGLRRFCRGANYVMAEVTDIDLKAKRVSYRPVTVDEQESPTRDISYDHVVLALGTVTLKPPVPGLAEHGFDMKDLADAFILKDRVVQLLEQASQTEDAETRRELLHLTVVGGGFTGVEVAGEFDRYMKQVAGRYPRLSADEIKVTILNRGDQILKTMPDRLGNWTRKHLTARGLDVRLDSEAKAIHEESVELKDGTILPARTVVWAAGIAPNPSVKFFDVPTDKRGYILCDRELRVEGFDHAWGLGDAAVNPQPHGQPYPATAQAAVGQAKIGAENIIRVLRGEKPIPCDLENKGTLAAFGHGDAVADVFGRTLTGWPAWLLWRAVYLSKMPGLGRKLQLLADWVVKSLSRRDFVEFGIERSLKKKSQIAVGNSEKSTD